jgi:hypothetical protein
MTNLSIEQTKRDDLIERLEMARRELSDHDLEATPRVVVQLMPLTDETLSELFAGADEGPVELPLFPHGGARVRISPRIARNTISVAKMFDDGALQIVRASYSQGGLSPSVRNPILDDEKQPKFLPVGYADSSNPATSEKDVSYERDVTKVATEAIELYKQLGVDVPILINVALLNVEGYPLRTGTISSPRDSSRSIDKTDFVSNGLVLELNDEGGKKMTDFLEGYFSKVRLLAGL